MVYLDGSAEMSDLSFQQNSMVEQGWVLKRELTTSTKQVAPLSSQMGAKTIVFLDKKRGFWRDKFVSSKQVASTLK